MKYLYFPIFFLLIIACTKEKAIYECNDCCYESNLSKQLIGSWKLMAYIDNEKCTYTYKSQENANGFLEKEVIIHFQDSLNIGKLWGNTLTNSFMGDYLILSNNSIKINNFGGTKVAEPNWGSDFWDKIQLVEDFEVSNNQLKLFYNSRKNALQFEAN
jgi:hypothetical protein